MEGRRALRCGILALAALVLASPASPQETREAEIAKKQEEKAANLAPYVPTRFEKFMTGFEQRFADPPSGFFPAFGRVYAGGSLSLGGGYRRFFGRKAVWDATALYSIRNYKLIEVGARTPWKLDGRWTLGASAGWLDAPAVGFFGIGPDQDFRGRANYHLSQAYVDGNAAFRPTRWIRLSGEAGIDDYDDQGRKGRHPSIETVYDPSRVPGLLVQPAYRPHAGHGRHRLAPVTGLRAERRVLRRHDRQQHGPR